MGKSRTIRFGAGLFAPLAYAIAWVFGVPLFLVLRQWGRMGHRDVVIGGISAATLAFLVVAWVVESWPLAKSLPVMALFLVSGAASGEAFWCQGGAYKAARPEAT